MNDQSFFRIRCEHVGGRRYAWAWRARFADDNLPFCDPAILEHKQKYWAANLCEPGIYIENGSKWPDILGHGGGFPTFFVTERVLNAMTAATLDITRVIPLPIVEVKARGKRLMAGPIPQYFVVEAPQRIEIDYKASEVPTDAEGKPIRPLPESPKWVLSLRSWSGADLMSWPNIWKRPSCSLICTEKVVKLAEREGWTNCRFEPIGAI